MAKKREWDRMPVRTVWYTGFKKRAKKAGYKSPFQYTQALEEAVARKK